MTNYRQLNTQEANEINDACCVEELDSILSKYDLQVYRRLCFYEDDTYFEYYLADCTHKTLARELGFREEIIANESKFNWLLKRIVA